MKQVSKKECGCSGAMRETKVSRTIPLAGRIVEIENVDAAVCELCGEVYLDGPTLLKLESKLLRQAALAKN